jgi:YHS domain-containing protein
VTRGRDVRARTPVRNTRRSLGGLGAQTRRAHLGLLLVIGLGCTGGPRSLGGYDRPPPDGVEVQDPVSGARCTKTPATEAAVFEARTFYFCDPASPARFADAPERFAYP